jgi:hypothetical protein
VHCAPVDPTAGQQQDLPDLKTILALPIHEFAVMANCRLASTSLGPTASDVSALLQGHVHLPPAAILGIDHLLYESDSRPSLDYATWTSRPFCWQYSMMSRSDIR